MSGKIRFANTKDNHESRKRESERPKGSCMFHSFTGTLSCRFDNYFTFLYILPTQRLFEQSRQTPHFSTVRFASAKKFCQLFARRELRKGGSTDPILQSPFFIMLFKLNDSSENDSVISFFERSNFKSCLKVKKVRLKPCSYFLCL